MKQLTNERNNAFLPGEHGDRYNQWLLHTPADFAASMFYSQADLKGKTPEKSKEERPEFLPGELGVRTVRACQPTTKPRAPHFFYQSVFDNFLLSRFLPGEPA
jgi:hypothetical protein